MTGAAGEPLGRPRLLLSGDVTARPTGLERALTRAGFHIDESPPGPWDAPPDALLTTLLTAAGDRLRELLAAAAAEPPRVIVFAAADPEGPALALALGAADALAAPVHLPELCARITARIRDRQAPSRTAYETRIRDSLRELADGARVLHPDEIALALVRRLGRALGLAHCAFVITRPGEDEGRVIADVPEGRAEHARLDLARYPEIGEAVRSRRPLSMLDTHAGGPGAAATMVVLPVTVESEVAGVLLMRSHESAPQLNATQLGLAGSLAEAAARTLDGARAEGARTVALTPPTLDRRLQEELERARRYSLGFSLILLGLDPPPDGEAAADAEAQEWQRQELGARLQRELRLPDFVSGYGEDEYAVVLPETGADGARRSVARLRERLAGISAGIVAYPHPAVSAPDDLFALVEAALRRGRAQGGERVGVAE